MLFLASLSLPHRNSSFMVCFTCLHLPLGCVSPETGHILLSQMNSDQGNYVEILRYQQQRKELFLIPQSFKAVCMSDFYCLFIYLLILI